MKETMSSTRPLIGITGNFGEHGCQLAEGYYLSVLQAGGTPLVIPPYEEPEVLDELLEQLDGIIFSGGGDLNPLMLGEEPLPALHSINPRRDAAEWTLLEKAFQKQVPMLGICRGCQLMAAVLGGKIYQDLASQHEGKDGAIGLIKHSQDLDRAYASHTVTLQKGSLLSRIFHEAETLEVNSFHHQAVSLAGPRLTVSAQARDGVIEAVESTEYKSVLGVQWHPECFILRGDRSMEPLFEWLTAEALSFRQARHLHRHFITLDSHCDTPMKFKEDRAENARMFGGRSKEALVDLRKMEQGHLGCSIMAAYLPQGPLTAEGYAHARQWVDHKVEQIRQAVDDCAPRATLALTPQEVRNAHFNGQKAIMTGIENGYAIGQELSLVEHFRRQGVVYMTLCHNGDNDLCDSARGKRTHGGLSAFGRDVIREMNRLGMLVDLSHASEESFYQAIEQSQTPIVCSHSSARPLCDHPRNLTLDQMKALARSGGVAQVTLYHGFLRLQGEASIMDAVDHLVLMARTMGIEHVGFGSDFDGDGGVTGVADASEVINFTRRLLARKFSASDLRLLWGENFLRVMQEAQDHAEKS